MNGLIIFGSMKEERDSVSPYFIMFILFLLKIPNINRLFINIPAEASVISLTGLCLFDLLFFL